MRGKLPRVFELSQVSPNPFSGRVEVRYGLPRGSEVELVVYNAVGRRVRTLVSGYEDAGYKRVEWDAVDDMGRRVSPGVYFVKMVAGGHDFVKKVMLLK